MKFYIALTGWTLFMLFFVAVAANTKRTILSEAERGIHPSEWLLRKYKISLIVALISFFAFMTLFMPF